VTENAQMDNETRPEPVGSTRRTIRQKPEGRLPKVLRLAAFSVVVLGGVLFALYRRAEGQLAESLLGAGSQMMMLADAERQDTPREVLVNGQRVHFSSGVAPFGSREVLDRFEARCEEVDGGVMSDIQRVMTEHGEDPRAAGRVERLGTVHPILRRDVGRNGFVACFDFGAESVGLRGVMERYHRYEQTHDLHDFGDVRYVFVEPAGENRTHFVAVWTEGSLRLDQLFPEEGDAHGSDFADVPRPPGARRTLTAHEVGDDQFANVYSGSQMDEGELADFYRRELPGIGWRILDSDDPRARRLEDDRHVLIAIRGEETLFLSLTTSFDGRGNAVIVTSHPVPGGTTSGGT